MSLPLVLAAGAGSGIAVRARLGPWRDAGAGLLRPAYVAAVVAVVALSPVWRTGFSTVVGQNGDVVLAVGSAQLVKEAPPTAVRPELPIDRIPLVWRSKYPIFYSLAAVSELSGLSVVAAFPLVAAALLAMASFGFFLFARYVLRAPPWAALAAMAAVGLGRLPLHIADHPFYNELWALFALPFILTAGAAFLRAPSGASLALLAVFGAIGTFAYPLMLPFPVLFLAVWAWRERARLRPFLRRPDGPAWVWVPATVAGLAVLRRADPRGGREGRARPPSRCRPGATCRRGAARACATCPSTVRLGCSTPAGRSWSACCSLSCSPPRRGECGAPRRMHACHSPSRSSPGWPPRPTSTTAPRPSSSTSRRWGCWPRWW